MPVIPGIKAEGDLLHTLQQEVAGLLNRRTPKFPGAQPVSFSARHLPELQKQDYYLCEKSDGMRCLMYLTCDGPDEVTYLIDRKNDYYHVAGLHFPLATDERDFHTNTLVDGELVNDLQPNGETELKYLVFDCLMLDGTSLMHRTLDKRLAYFRDAVFNPYQTLYLKYPDEKQYLKFDVDFKKMEFSYGIEMMFKEILPHLPHGSDGLIFTCVNSPYQFGTDQNILKWKPEDENSIDFRLKLEFPMADPDPDDEDRSPYVDYDAMPIVHLEVLHNGGENLTFSTLFMDEAEWEGLRCMNQPLDGRVVECVQDQKSRWRFLRFRDDKKEANHISTVNSVIESIQDKVTKDDLIRNSKKVRDEWKKRHQDARAKVEEARKASDAQMEPNGQNGTARIPSSGTKRKFEDTADSTNGRDITKRRITPPLDQLSLALS